MAVYPRNTTTFQPTIYVARAYVCHQERSGAASDR